MFNHGTIPHISPGTSQENNVLSDYTSCLVLGSETRTHHWSEVYHFVNRGEGTLPRGERASAGEKQVSPGHHGALEGRLIDNHTG